MASQAPDHRVQRVLDAVRDGSDDDLVEPLERSLFHLVKTGEAPSSEIEGALRIYRDEEYRHVFSALALAGANEEAVTVGLGLADTVFSAFKYLFFDASVFEHNLEKARYVRRLQCDEEHRKLYELAVERGPGELIERYRIGERPRLEPESVIYDAMGDMWSKFLAHRGYTVTSDHAKEALRWGEAALRTAKLVLDNSREERKNAGTVDDLRIALEIRNETRTPADLNIAVDDLVTE
jgi:hypothetical protein